MSTSTSCFCGRPCANDSDYFCSNECARHDSLRALLGGNGSVTATSSSVKAATENKEGDKHSSFSHYRLVELQRKSEYEDIFQGALQVQTNLIATASACDDASSDEPSSPLSVASPFTSRVSTQLSPTPSAESPTSSCYPRTPSNMSQNNRVVSRRGTLGDIEPYRTTSWETAASVPEPTASTLPTLTAKQMSDAHQRTVNKLFHAIADARGLVEAASRPKRQTTRNRTERDSPDAVFDLFNDDTAALFTAAPVLDSPKQGSNSNSARPVMRTIRALSALPDTPPIKFLAPDCNSDAPQTPRVRFNSEATRPNLALRHPLAPGSGEHVEASKPSSSVGTLLRLPKTLGKRLSLFRLRATSQTEPPSSHQPAATSPSLGQQVPRVTGPSPRCKPPVEPASQMPPVLVIHAAERPSVSVAQSVDSDSDGSESEGSPAGSDTPASPPMRLFIPLPPREHFPRVPRKVVNYPPPLTHLAHSTAGKRPMSVLTGFEAMCSRSTLASTHSGGSDLSAYGQNGHTDEGAVHVESSACQSYPSAPSTWTNEGRRGGAAALRQEHVLAMRTSFAGAQPWRTSQDDTMSLRQIICDHTRAIL